MMPLADLFVHVYVLADDAIKGGKVRIPSRPGPKHACTDADVLTIALVRHLLGRPSERAFLEEVRQNWAHYFPNVPAQSEFNRRVRWLWGAFEALRQQLVNQLPEDAWQQTDPPCRSSIPAGCCAQTGGRVRAGFGQASAGMLPTASGLTASGWPCALTWGAGW